MGVGTSEAIFGLLLKLNRTRSGILGNCRTWGRGTPKSRRFNFVDSFKEVDPPPPGHLNSLGCRCWGKAEHRVRPGRRTASSLSPNLPNYAF